MASKTPAKKLQTGRRMEDLFQLLRKKDETLPPGPVEVLSWRADLGRRKSLLAGLTWDEGKRVVELAVLAEGL